MNITKTEQLMLDVMAELALAEEPIVFKGAMTLKLAVDGKTQTDICRTTRDIDGDWMRQNASMEEMRCGRETRGRNFIRHCVPHLFGEPIRWILDLEPLRHAYEKLDDVVHKPDFDTLYARLSTFLKPFIENSMEPSVWNGMAWTDPQCEQGKTVRHGR